MKRFASVYKSKSGVARIKRDGYSTNSGLSQRNHWWTIRAEVWKRDGGLCVDHKRKGLSVKANEVHHIIPLSRGGTTTKSNLISLCMACHERRHPSNKHLAEYHRGKK